jgi:hypothetical protein
MDFHREKAKMLAATNQREEFFQQMKIIRNADSSAELDVFFAALSHELVARDLREDLRRFYFTKQDTAVLLRWPDIDKYDVVDGKAIIKLESQNSTGAAENFSFNSQQANQFQSAIMESKNRSTSQTSAIPAHSVIYKVRPNTKQDREMVECFKNLRVITGAVMMYNMDNKIKEMRSLKDEDVMSPNSPLITGGYLRTPPIKPNSHCYYMSSGDLSSDAADDNAVFCRYHGGFWKEKVVKFIVSDDAANSGKYQSMDIDDLKLDLDSLLGQKVKVAALGQYFSNSLIIKRDMMDTNPMFVEVKNIPREQMKYLIQNCNTGAEIIVSGTVGEVSFQKGIVADKIEW